MYPLLPTAITLNRPFRCHVLQCPTIMSYDRPTYPTTALLPAQLGKLGPQVSTVNLLRIEAGIILKAAVQVSEDQVP